MAQHTEYNLEDFETAESVSNSHVSSLTQGLVFVKTHCLLEKSLFSSEYDLPSVTEEDISKLIEFWKNEIDQMEGKDEKKEVQVIQPAIWNLVKQMTNYFYPENQFTVAGSFFGSSTGKVTQHTQDTVKRSRVFFPYSGIPDLEIVEESANLNVPQRGTTFIIR